MLLRWLNKRSDELQRDRAAASVDGAAPTAKAQELLRRGDEYARAGDHIRAVDAYQELIGLAPDHALALHNLGAALCNMGRLKDAEIYFRRAIAAQPDFSDAHNNLGSVLRTLGRVAQSEVSIRRAAECDPMDTNIQVNLGLTLLTLGRMREAERCFSDVLRIAPDRIDAIVGMGNIARMEGRFADAEARYQQALASDRNLPAVWASLAALRKMTVADADWLGSAQQLAASGLGPTDEAGLRFAIGKYWNDLGEFEPAFHSYQRANELLKSVSRKYDGAGRSAYVDAMIRIYTRESLAQVSTVCDSNKPVLVVGMPRSGTSLVEQIIASHPDAKGAGELGFWTEVLFEHATTICQQLLPESLRRRLAEAYLAVLADHVGEAPCVVDKAPVNSEYLGWIYSVLPKARIIYLRRNPIDTCLSCYFQYLSPAMSYAMDLADLAHYYRTHHRLMAHWRAVLPPSAVLEVPYEALVANQEEWTRRILNFIDLEWDPRCLDFHTTRRPVVTASSWQVRQKLYQSSIERWRNYEKFIGPLLSLSDLA